MLIPSNVLKYNYRPEKHRGGRFLYACGTAASFIYPAVQWWRYDILNRVSPSLMARSFHSVSPSLDQTALFMVSRSWTLPGLLKTSAANAGVHNVFWYWAKGHPAKMDTVSGHSSSWQRLAKQSWLVLFICLSHTCTILTWCVSVVDYNLRHIGII